LRCDGGDGDASGTNFLGRGFFGVLVVAENQEGNNQKDEQRQEPPNEMRYLTPRLWRSGGGWDRRLLIFRYGCRGVFYLGNKNLLGRAGSA
jgi:hypothetical protein